MNITARRNIKGAKRRRLIEAVGPITAVVLPGEGRFAVDVEGEDESVTIKLTRAEAQHILNALGARFTGA